MSLSAITAPTTPPTAQPPQESEQVRLNRAIGEFFFKNLTSGATALTGESVPMEKLAEHAKLLSGGDSEMLSKIEAHVAQIVKQAEQGNALLSLNLIDKPLPSADDSFVIPNTPNSVSIPYNIPDNCTAALVKVLNEKDEPIATHALNVAQKGAGSLDVNQIQDNQGAPLKPDSYKFILEGADQHGEGLSLRAAAEKIIAIHRAPENGDLVLRTSRGRNASPLHIIPTAPMPKE